jgi:hypothetical protein
MAEDINAPIWDLTGKYTGNKLYPKDIYSSDAGRLYSSGMDYDNQAISILQSVKDRPNARITIYRAVPKDAKGKINAGDWVTLVRDYAKDHGESNLGGKYKIIKQEVHARDIFTDANSIQEFGYDPQGTLRGKDVPFDLIKGSIGAEKPNIHTGYLSELKDIYNQAHLSTQPTGAVPPATPTTPAQVPFQPVSGKAKIGKPPQMETGSVIDRIKTKAHQLYTQGVDRYHPMSYLAKQGGKEAEMQGALAQHYGAGSTANYHLDYELKPILKNVNAGDFDDYVIAQRDIELAGRGIKGSDKQMAEQVLADLKNKYGGDLSSLENTANKVYDYQKKMVQEYLVKTGVLSEENAKAMFAKNQKYVPFKRIMDYVDDYLGVSPNKKSAGSVGSQDVIKGIKGSERQIYDPLESIVNNTYKIVALGRRNNVAKTLVSMKDTLPDTIQEYHGETFNKPIVSVFENGKVHKYLVPRDVAESAKGLNTESLNAVIKILSFPTKIVRATATAYNPEFLAPNIARDVQSAYVNTGSNPLNFIKGFAHLLKKDKVYQEFLKSGGRTSRVSIDRPHLVQTVAGMTGKGGMTIKKPSDLLGILQTMGEYSEQPTRIGAFEKAYNEAVKKGMTSEQAQQLGAYASQEGTVNFARMGSKMQSANALIAFLNARLQGADRLARSIKTDPKGAGFRLAVITQVPMILSYLNNMRFKSYYDKRVVSDRDRTDNYIFMLSDTPIKQLGGLQYIKIPKGDVGKFANPTEKFLDYARGKGDNEMFKSIADAFLSLSPVDNMGGTIPSAVKPVVENTYNKNFFTGQEIVPEYKKSYPAKYQYTNYTPAIYRMMGEKLNLSPAKIENLVGGYTTGIARIAENANQPKDNRGWQSIRPHY